MPSPPPFPKAKASAKARTPPKTKATSASIRTQVAPTASPKAAQKAGSAARLKPPTDPAKPRAEVPPHTPRQSAKSAKQRDATSPSLAASPASAINDTMGGFARAYQHWLQAAVADPARLQAWQSAQVAAQGDLLQHYLQGLSQTQSTADAAARWQQYLSVSHQAAGASLLKWVDETELDADEKRRMRFFMKQYVDATAPQNQLFGNAEALQLAQETRGDSLRAGLENLMADVKRGHISMTDETAFAVGKNLALTPGGVVFENAVMQVIQYQATTAKVYERPLLIVPPCINKFYILDLQPENSLVRYAVEQGFTVFLVSWKNIQSDGAHLTWADYVEDGVIRAVTVCKEVSGAAKINTLGFCVGGTLLGTALAVLAARKQDVVTSATFLTTLLDFSDVGEIRAYIDQPFVQAREAALREGGVVSGAELAQAFASLRANDLIWSFVINNYLKGKKPAAFDLLYWNGDSTNLPGPMYAYYLRNMYLENRLAKRGDLDVNGTPVDLKRVTVPSFVFAAKEDHIVPWRTACVSGQLLGGSVQFVLGASGHIAGVVNPAHKNKRSFWAGGKGQSPDAWFASANESPGSWWPMWSKWLAGYAGKHVAAPQKLGGKNYRVIEPAPGRYVTQKC